MRALLSGVKQLGKRGDLYNFRFVNSDLETVVPSSLNPEMAFNIGAWSGEVIGPMPHGVPVPMQVNDILTIGHDFIQLINEETGLMKWTGPDVWGWTTRAWITDLESDPPRPEEGAPYEGSWGVTFVLCSPGAPSDGAGLLGRASMTPDDVDRAVFPPTIGEEGLVSNAYSLAPGPLLAENQEFHLAVWGLAGGVIGVPYTLAVWEAYFEVVPIFGSKVTNFYYEP